MNLKEILSIAYRSKFKVLIIIVSSIIIIVSTSYLPEYLGRCFKQLEDYHDIKSYQSIYGLIIIFVLRAVFKLVRNQITFGIGNDVVLDMRLKAVKSLFQNLTARNKVRDYSILTYDLNFLSEIISYRTFMFLENSLIFLFSLYWMMKTSGIVTLSVLPFIILLFITSRQYSNKMNTLIKKIRTSIDKITEVTFENIKGQKVIKSINAQNSELKRFDTENRNNFENTLKINKVHAKYIPIINVSSYIALLTCVSSACILTLIGELNISSVVVFYGYMLLLFDVVNCLSNTILFYANSKESLRRMASNMNFEEKDNVNQLVSVHKGQKKNIVIKNLNYCINGREILKNISAIFGYGNIITITGEMGSGKSTLLKMIAGILATKRGEILINNYDLTDCKIDAYRNITGYVSQDPVFFNSSLLNNILLGRNNIENEYLSFILKKCIVDEIVKNVGGDMGVLVNRDAVRFSGGENQRICLARALIGNPDVLIIDDALTAIDEANRSKILNYLCEIKRNKTIIMVSNLEQILQISDEIYNLKDGTMDKIK